MLDVLEVGVAGGGSLLVVRVSSNSAGPVITTARTSSLSRAVEESANPGVLVNTTRKRQLF